MIRCNQLTSLYGGTRRGLSDFSAELEDGKVYGLLGKNGAGKTTLIRIIMGILFPQSGTCEVEGYGSLSRHPEMLMEIGLVPEEYYLPAISPQNYIAHWSKFYPRFDHDLMKSLLAEWNFPPTDLLGKLSQGEKKKFVISFALATQAKWLLLDEPTNGLDITSKLAFKKIIHDYQKNDRSVIISTHQIKDVDMLLEKIIVVDEGVHLGTFDRKRINERFELKIAKAPVSGALFSMEGVEGYWSLVAKKVAKKEEKAIDLELFFTAFLQETEKILGFLKKEQTQ